MKKIWNAAMLIFETALVFGCAGTAAIWASEEFWRVAAFFWMDAAAIQLSVITQLRHGRERQQDCLIEPDADGIEWLE